MGRQHSFDSPERSRREFQKMHDHHSVNDEYLLGGRNSGAVPLMQQQSVSNVDVYIPCHQTCDQHGDWGHIDVQHSSNDQAYLQTQRDQQKAVHQQNQAYPQNQGYCVDSVEQAHMLSEEANSHNIPIQHYSKL